MSNRQLCSGRIRTCTGILHSTSTTCDLSTYTLKIEEFVGSLLEHEYAILSHTWQHGQEVTFHEWNAATAGPPSTCDGIQGRQGYAKIKASWLQARSRGLDYLWVDTDCIDKTSSAELSEAINSMYFWYRHSAVCFAYLADVSGHDLADNECRAQLRSSRWFTRGFTLQELVAPIDVVFFSQDWHALGTKDTLVQTIANITGVRAKVLTLEDRLSSVCIAEKMLWLAKRTTTRIEDMAYCMLGILDINMPLLYDEGAQAFIRLQRKIIKVRNDHTIFCWMLPTASVSAREDILVSNPSCFANCGTIGETPKKDWRASSYAMTNAGLRIQLPLIRGFSNFFAVLDAVDSSLWDRDNSRGEGLRICLPLEGSLSGGIFQRSEYPGRPPLLPSTWAAVASTEVYIPPIRRRELRTRSVPLDEVRSRFALLLLFDTAEDDLSRSVQSIALPWLIGNRRAATFDTLRSVLELVALSDNQPARGAVYGALLYLTDQSIGKRRILFLGVRREQRRDCLRLCWIQNVSDPLQGRDFTADKVVHFWTDKCQASLQPSRRLKSSGVLPQGWAEFGPVALTEGDHIGHLKPVLIKLSGEETADLVQVTHTVTRVPTLNVGG
ncbi:HET domain-containing protein [Apiospora phragmitis]|uniref:HET domain-containing protein n=1 Tax=Apiospora phragmitis TaxID=2905665 RepID=A0ABR1VZN8_9PEZI